MIARVQPGVLEEVHQCDDADHPPVYLDKNYAAIFIFWDKLFGTYEVENEPVRFGLTKPFNAYNPFKIAFYEFGMVIKATAAAKGIRGKVYELFRKPY